MSQSNLIELIRDLNKDIVKLQTQGTKGKLFKQLKNSTNSTHSIKKR